MQLDELRVDIPTSLNTNLVHFVELKISCDLVSNFFLPFLNNLL